MKVGLIQIDGKRPNLALMKLSKWHRDKGDEVVIVDLSSFKADTWYGSKIFMGGSGYDIKGKLPNGIEEVIPDYKKFNLDYSVGFTSRGCVRNCSFCIVREKEGLIHEVNMDWIKHNKILILDNNFFASEKWKEKMQYFIDNKLKVCFNQGLDIRLIDDINAKMLSKVDYRDDSFKTKRIYFAWDNLEDESQIFKGIDIMLKYGIKTGQLMFYVLVNFNTTLEQDMYRIKKLAKIGCKPYVMVYNKPKAPKIIKDLQRWVNRRYYNFIEWEDYNKKKDVKK